MKKVIKAHVAHKLARNIEALPEGQTTYRYGQYERYISANEDGRTEITHETITPVRGGGLEKRTVNLSVVTSREEGLPRVAEVSCKDEAGGAVVDEYAGSVDELTIDQLRTVARGVREFLGVHEWKNRPVYTCVDGD